MAPLSTILAEPLKLPCGVVVPNRLVKAALTEGLADEWNRATDELCTLYRGWSEEGCGLLITGNVQVDRNFMERAGNVAIDGPQSRDSLCRLENFAAAAKSGGSLVFMQIGHAGRQTEKRVNKHAVGPSGIAFDDANPEAPSDCTTRALSFREILDIQTRFVQAALVAKQCGFDGVQIHSAHGYLLSSFLNPLANQRDDSFGGSLENRSRLLLDTISEVRKAVGTTYPVSVKINSADFQKGGFSVEECEQVAHWLDLAGIDFLELSGGNYENPVLVTGSWKNPGTNQSSIRREAYFLEFADGIRRALKNTPLMVTGGFRSKAFMEKCLTAGDCNLIGVGRPLCGGMHKVCKKLLAGEILVLPEYEHSLLFPWWAYPLFLFKIGAVMKFALQQMWYYHNTILLAAGKETAYYRNFWHFLKVRSYDNNKAMRLKELDCEGYVHRPQKK
ncbi:hypothetical protein CYMTET_55723 [Cymbomonas tetramitiformis]|uniref:NADH:flavin oxidoreductase/NADH oxidase N-terminal domain-containing protein n=1 Tax=Cymbomonas tetramitiformis TaxID=36881 RepID=A0AAE0EPG7_9CHLO|nr:hypothetical protein CYMTET_55723 [Cymbomonas tetramitiformis]